VQDFSFFSRGVEGTGYELTANINWLRKKLFHIKFHYVCTDGKFTILVREMAVPLPSLLSVGENG